VKWVRRNTDNPTTASTYRAQVATLVTGSFSSADLTPARVSRWLTELPDVSSGTRRKYLAALYSFANYLVEQDVLAENPIRGRVKSPAKNPKRVRWETEATDRAIVDAVRVKHADVKPLEGAIRAAMAFVKGSSTDVGYALPPHLKLRHLGLDQGTAQVRGKTSRRLSQRIVIVEPWALTMLRAHVQTAALGPNDDVFAGVTRYMLHHYHAEACEAAGVADYTLKDARHSVAVRWRLKGMSWEWIADLLGNTVYQVVETYTHMTRSIEDRLAEVVGKGEPGAGKQPAPYLVDPDATARTTSDPVEVRPEIRRDD
jgi:site-specific recombinase XerD